MSIGVLYKELLGVIIHKNCVFYRDIALKHAPFRIELESVPAVLPV